MTGDTVTLDLESFRALMRAATREYPKEPDMVLVDRIVALERNVERLRLMEAALPSKAYAQVGVVYYGSDESASLRAENARLRMDLDRLTNEKNTSEPLYIEAQRKNAEELSACLKEKKRLRAKVDALMKATEWADRIKEARALPT